MPQNAFDAYQRGRFMRPDAARWLRPDIARFLKSGSSVSNLHADFGKIERKYSPAQPRDDWGRWTSGRLSKPFGFLGIDGTQQDESESGGSDDTGSNTFGDEAVTMFDVDPDSIGDAGDQLAQNRTGRGSINSVSINGQQFELSPAQGARLSVAQARAEDAIASVREFEPDWKPQPSLYQTPEGLIRAYEADTFLAQTRANELAAARAAPGPYTNEILPSATRLMEAYRSENGDLFGRRSDGTIAVSAIDGRVIIASNSTFPGYTTRDGDAARQIRDDLIVKYPEIFPSDNLGYRPNDALFHAESTTLLRAANGNKEVLSGYSLDIFVDRLMCRSCNTVLPYIGRELGNPTVRFFDPSGSSKTISGGNWIK